MQVSIILQSLNDETRLTYSKKYVLHDRDIVINALLAELNDANTALGSAYANSQLNEINSAHISSSDVSYVLSQFSDCHGLFSSIERNNDELIPVMALTLSRE